MKEKDRKNLVRFTNYYLSQSKSVKKWIQTLKENDWFEKIPVLVEAGDIPSELYEMLWDENQMPDFTKDMPYGIAKVKEGDPFDWCLDKLEGLFVYAKRFDFSS